MPVLLEVADADVCLCDAPEFSAMLRLVQVHPNAHAVGAATVQLSAVEVRAPFAVLGFVARERSIAEKPDRDMAARLQAQLELWAIRASGYG